MYRKGVVGSISSDSGTATKGALTSGGFPIGFLTLAGSPETGTPIFRSVPDRWLVMRTVRPCPSGSFVNRIMV